MPKILEYIREDGSNPYERWFESLKSQAAAKVAIAITRLELGNISNVKWFSGIGEYKINWGPGYRIYLAMEEDRLIILFGGGTKKTKKKQQEDIKKAKELLAEYNSRKKRKLIKN
jgi:putative addiction module killer protein